MNCAFGVALLGMSLLPLNASAQAKAASSTLSKSSQTKTSAAKSKTTAASAKHRKLASRYTRRAAPPRPSYQLHPDPERYQQIQQALAERGYFKGQANGEWGDDSVEALKRFQVDQKLEDDGKISALTLIGLGLGPNHAAGAAAVSAPASSNAAPTAGTASAESQSNPPATAPAPDASTRAPATAVPSTPP